MPAAVQVDRVGVAYKGPPRGGAAGTGPHLRRRPPQQLPSFRGKCGACRVLLLFLKQSWWQDVCLGLSFCCGGQQDPPRSGWDEGWLVGVGTG